MSVWVWVGVIAIVVAIVYVAFTYTGEKTDGVVILKDSQEGSKVVSSSVVLPRSFNEKEGAVYSWTGWILVKNFTSGFGQRRRIFSVGDAPGLYIDSTSNTLIASIKTYSAAEPETLMISNIPAMKWVHFAIVVDQTSVNFYINGTLRMYHTLSNLPMQTNDSVTFGGEWDGVVGRVEYYPYALSNARIFLKASEQPPSDLMKKPASGSYFDMTWYTGRL
jgi:hypothetical protein